MYVTEMVITITEQVGFFRQQPRRVSISWARSFGEAVKFPCYVALLEQCLGFPVARQVCLMGISTLLINGKTDHGTLTNSGNVDYSEPAFFPCSFPTPTPPPPLRSLHPKNRRKPKHMKLNSRDYRDRETQSLESNVSCEAGGWRGSGELAFFKNSASTCAWGDIRRCPTPA